MDHYTTYVTSLLNYPNQLVTHAVIPNVIVILIRKSHYSVTEAMYSTPIGLNQNTTDEFKSTLYITIDS